MGVTVKRVGASAPQLLPLMPQLQACRCGATNGKFGPKRERLTASPIFCQLQTLFRDWHFACGPCAYIPRGPVIVASDCSVLAQAARNLAGEPTDVRTSARLNRCPATTCARSSH